MGGCDPNRPTTQTRQISQLIGRMSYGGATGYVGVRCVPSKVYRLLLVHEALLLFLLLVWLSA